MHTGRYTAPNRAAAPGCIGAAGTHGTLAGRPRQSQLFQALESTLGTAANSKKRPNPTSNSSNGYEMQNRSHAVGDPAIVERDHFSEGALVTAACKSPEAHLPALRHGRLWSIGPLSILLLCDNS
jgi:hypothetical protein